MNVLLLIFLSFPSLAAEDFDHNDCVIRREISLGSTLLKRGECWLSQSLSLDEGYFFYNLGGTRRVSYWKGGYSRKENLSTRFLREYFDSCTWNHRVIHSEDYTVLEERERFFPLKNPNLDPGLSSSFELIPLTEREAQSALRLAKGSCEKR